MDTGTVRTAVGASVSALAPVALWWSLALPPSGAGLPEGSGGALALALLGAACLGLFAAYRVRTGFAAPGILAALLLGAFPATADMVASPHGLEALGALAGSALLLLLYATRRVPAERRLRERRSFVVFGITLGVLSLGAYWGTSRFGARAFSPPWALGLTAGVLGGEAALEVLRSLGRGPAGERLGRWGAALLVLALAGTGALSIHRSRSWESPVAFWERALREEPGSVAALGASARARAEAGDLAGAAALLRRFVEGVETGASAALRGEEARRAGAEGAAGAALALLRAAGGDREAALAGAAAARRLLPASPEVLLAAGEARLAEEDLAGATETLEEAVRRDPGKAGAWDALARAYLAAARLPGALEAAGRALGLAPDRRDCARTLAEALLGSRRDLEAALLLRKTLGSPPYDPAQAQAYADAYWRIARRQVSACHKGRARGLLREGLRVWPLHAPSLSLLRELDSEFAAELPELQAMIRPDAAGNVAADPDTLLVLAVRLCRWGEFEMARPFFRALVDQRGGTAAVHYHLGLEFWEEQGTAQAYEEAVKCYRDALVREPGYVEARNRLWQTLRTLGRAEEARAEARKFLEEAPTHPDAYDAEELVEAGGAATPPGPGR